VLLEGRGEGQREDLVVLHPSEVLPEGPEELHPSEERLEVRVVQVVNLRQEDLEGLRPLKEPLEDLEVPLVGPAGLHPSEEQQVGLEEMLEVHWGVDQGVLQKPRGVVLKMVDLRLREDPEVMLVDPEELHPSEVRRVDQAVQVVGLQQVDPVV